MLLVQRLFGCCLPLQGEYMSDTESNASERPLLDRSRKSKGADHKHTMKKSRRPVYGSKKKVFNPASAAIFGSNGDGTSSAPGPSARQALADITEAVSNIKIHDDEHDKIVIGNVSGDDQRPPKSKPIPIDRSNAPPEFLEPLAAAYLEDVGRYLQIKQWEHIIFDNEHTLEKIAEASYAEVYRVTEISPVGNNAPATSILKIMRLKSPEDPTSLDCEKAIEVSNVVSEFRILNDLADIPGFVVYKAAQLLQGVPTASCVAAWDDYKTRTNGETEFPDPRECSDKALFLVIELADAGIVLEDYQITTIAEAWDIFLGTVNALARGEQLSEFEHRDLHENNICVIRRNNNSMLDGPNTSTEQRFGFSGLEITLIDYGLSRTTLQNGEIMYCDLEKDLDVFRGQDQHKQFDAYRRMRSFLFTNERKLHRAAWHDENSRPPNSREWSAYVPYTNVIWLDYLLDYIKKQMVKNCIDMKERKTFNEEMKELVALMNPRTKWDDGAFPGATHMMVYILEKKWMTYAQAGWLTDQGQDEIAQHDKSKPKGKENERPEPQAYDSNEYQVGIHDMKSHYRRKKKLVKPYPYNTGGGAGDRSYSTNTITSDKGNFSGLGHAYFSDSDDARKEKVKPKVNAKLTGKDRVEKQAAHTYFPNFEKESNPRPKPNPKKIAPSFDDTSSGEVLDMKPKSKAKAKAPSFDDTSSDEFLEMKIKSKPKAKAIRPEPSRFSPPPAPKQESMRKMTRTMRAAMISEAGSSKSVADDDETIMPLRRSPRKNKGKK